MSAMCHKRTQWKVTYSITSLASTSRVGGTVRPRTFAALKLTTRSNLTGACTGRLATLSPFKNAIDIGRCPTHQIDVVHAVGQQSAFHGLITIGVNCWQPVASREENDQLTMHRGEGIRHYN